MSSFFSPNNTKPKTTTLPLTGTTSQFKTDTLLVYGLRYMHVFINNKDPIANLTIKTEPNGTDITIPPLAQGTVEDEIHNYIEINPNAVSGNYEARLQLVSTEELKRLGLIQ